MLATYMEMQFDEPPPTPPAPAPVIVPDPQSGTLPDAPTLHAPTPHSTPRPSVNRLIEALRSSNEDHEFYPTTDEIIRTLTRSIGLVTVNEHGNKYRGNFGSFSSVLDIGAGNGKVLLALRDKCDLTEMHAIEKSSILCAQLDPRILVVGTDFHEQSLLSKQVDVIFCNPPYSQFEEWTQKIIREAAAKAVFLVIPQRWENSVIIKDALRFRDVKARKVSEFDFEDAEDRKSRANVHLLRIDFHDRKPDDAFERFFQEQFADLINRFKADTSKTDPENADAADRDPGETTAGGRHRPFHKLVPGPNYPDAMVNLYRAEMDNIHKNYQLVGQLDVDLLREFEIFPAKIMACLKARLSGLKNDYWSELFSRLKAVTDRLTSKSRKQLLETLQKHVEVDFTVTNIYEIIIWVIKNANRYLEEQLVETYALMVDKCNVHLYKSNKRVWVDEGWRYNKDPEKNSHYALDYRIVTHRVGGVNARWGSKYELDDRAGEFLGDLMTLARNLGFNCSTVDERLARWSHQELWHPGETQSFHFMESGLPFPQNAELFDVRAFKNGNLHLRLNQKFILALNVEHGRLRGWLRTPEQAAEQLQDEAAATYFRKNLQLGTGDPTRLLCAIN